MSAPKSIFAPLALAFAMSTGAAHARDNQVVNDCDTVRTVNHKAHASWYGPGFHGRQTASGERYDENGLTAAHGTLPLPSIARVTLLKTGKSILVRINDRGPFSKKRIIDLSKGSAKEIGLIKYGVAKVRVEYLPDETEQYLAGLGIPVPAYMKDRVPVTNADVVAIKRSKFEANGAYAKLEPKHADTEEKPSLLASLFGGGAAKKPAAHKSGYSANSASNPIDVSYQPMRRQVPLETVDAAAVDSIKVSDTAPMDLMAVNDLPAVEAAEKPVSAPKASVSFSAKPSKQPVISASILDVTNQKMSASTNTDAPFKIARDDVPAASSSLSKEAQDAQDAQFLIQAGSFSGRTNAQKQVDALASVAKAEIKEASISGSTIYRVVLGPVKSQDDASKLHELVLARGYNDARIIKK